MSPGHTRNRFFLRPRAARSKFVHPNAGENLRLDVCGGFLVLSIRLDTVGVGNTRLAYRSFVVGLTARVLFPLVGISTSVAGDQYPCHVKLRVVSDARLTDSPVGVESAKLSKAVLRGTFVLVTTTVGCSMCSASHTTDHRYSVLGSAVLSCRGWRNGTGREVRTLAVLSCFSAGVMLWIVSLRSGREFQPSSAW